VNYQPTDPVRVTERGQMQLGDVLRFTRIHSQEEEVFVRGLDENMFASVVAAVDEAAIGHPYLLYRRSYADNQVKCPQSYPTAVNYVEIVGHVDAAQVEAMLADCLDCTRI